MTNENFLALGLADRYMYLSKILRYSDSLPEEETEVKANIAEEFARLSSIINN